MLLGRGLVADDLKASFFGKDIKGCDRLLVSEFVLEEVARDRVEERLHRRYFLTAARVHPGFHEGLLGQVLRPIPVVESIVEIPVYRLQERIIRFLELLAKVRSLVLHIKTPY